MNDLLKLEDVCEEMFGICIRVARRKALLGQLPVPAFRLNEARKGPFFVRQSDLDELAETRTLHAKQLHRRMASVS